MTLFGDYGNVDDISYRLLLPSLLFSIVTPIFVIARFVSQKIYIKHIAADDWVILASLAFAQTTSTLMIIIAQGAFGKHKDDVPKSILAKSSEIYFFVQITYKVTIGLTKISILLLYIKVFARPWFIKTCWAWLAVESALTLATVLSTIFQCTPVAFAFKKTQSEGTCINLIAFWFISATLNIVGDFMIIILPVPVIVRLQLPMKKKVALCCVFAVGLVVCIASIMQLTSLDIEASRIDPTWTNIASCQWTVIEANLGVISACLPTLWRPLSITFSKTSRWITSLLPAKHVSSNSTSKSQSIQKGKAKLSSAASTTAHIGLQSIDYRIRRDDPWSRVSHSAEKTETYCGSGGDDIASGRRGSDDQILGWPKDEEETPVDNSGIRKTTHVVVQYGSRSDDEDDDGDLGVNIDVDDN